MEVYELALAAIFVALKNYVLLGGVMFAEAYI